jgi:hypothetical protein
LELDPPIESRETDELIVISKSSTDEYQIREIELAQKELANRNFSQAKIDSKYEELLEEEDKVFQQELAEIDGRRFSKGYYRDFIDFFNFFKLRKKNNVVYQNIFFVGLLCLWVIYHNSNYLLIPIKDLSIVCITADILITLSFLRFYKNNFSLGWALLHNLTIGLIACYLFFWTNDKFSSKPTMTKTLQIENVDLQDSHRRYDRGLEPVLTVNIKGIEHTITYRKEVTRTALNARQLEVKLKKGFWDYWVLKSIQIVNNE